MLNKKKLGGRYEFQFDISSDTIALIYFAERYRFDLITLLLLYEKFGRDVFYFFFMLAGRKIMFPKANKFLNITEFCKNVTRELLEGKPATINNKEYKAVYDSVMDKVVEENGVKRFSHSIRVYNNESTMTTLGTKNLSMLQTERLMTYYKEMFSFYNTTLTTLSKVLVSVSPTATFEERELVKTFRGLDWKEKQKLFRLLEAVKDE